MGLSDGATIVPVSANDQTGVYSKGRAKLSQLLTMKPHARIPCR